MTDDNIKQLIERLRQRINSKYMLMSDPPKPAPDADCHMAADLLQEALAFKQKVSDEVQEWVDHYRQEGWEGFDRFIIPKPDPLVEILDKATDGGTTLQGLADRIRTALDARGLEIREKGQ